MDKGTKSHIDVLSNVLGIWAWSKTSVAQRGEVLDKTQRWLTTGAWESKLQLLLTDAKQPTLSCERL